MRCLISPFPNVAETDCRVEPIEDGQRHCHVSDDGPCPEAGEQTAMLQVEMSSKTDP